LIAALSDSFPQFVEVLEVETRKLQWSKDPGRWPMIALEFTADSKTLILAGWAVRSIPPATDNTLVFLDARTGVEQQRIDLGTRAPDRIALSPDGTRLVGICHGAKTFERGLLVWDVAGRKETLRMDPSKNEVVRGQDYFSALAFARGGKSLVTAGGFDGLIEWDLATGKELRRLGRRTMNADCLALAPDGKTLAVAWGSAVRLLDAATGEDRLPEAGHFYRINGAAVTPDGGTVYTYSAGPSMMLWEAATGRLKGRVEAPELGSQWYGVVDDGRTAFSTTVMGTTLLVHDLPSGKIRSRVPLDFAGDRAGPVAVSPDGRTVACKSYASESIQLVSVATGQRLRTLEDPGMKNCRVAFTAGGQTLLVSCADHTFQVWDPVKGIKLRQFGPIGDSSSPNPLPIGQDFAGYEFAVSTDGARVAYANERGQFALIDAVTGRELPRRALPRVSNAVFAFSPDSRTLAWGARRDPVLHLMEVASGKDRCVLNGHGSGVSSLSFSADGTTLVAGCEDSTALVRDLTGRRTRAKADGPLTAGGLDARWTALAGEDAAKAFQAIRELANSPDETLPYLARRLRPVPAADEKRLTRLIADLDGEAFAVREKAGGELADIGDAALASCHKALAGRPSAEVRSRLEGIVEKRAQAWRALSGEELRTERALEVLERIGTPPARRFLDRLAGGLPEARLTREAKAATERLSRRESPAP
jgi:WD40 repeat protein